MKTRKPNKPQENYTDEFLLNHLKELAVKLKRTPFGRDIEKAGLATYAVYYKRFGSFTKAQEMAGLEPTKKTDTPKYTDEEILNHLRELAAKLGRSPKIKDVMEAGKVSIAIYNKRFRKYSKAVAKAGLIPVKSGRQQH